MPDSTDLKIADERRKSVSRRRFIKGVIAGGAAVSSATYLFRASITSAADASERLITLNVNGQDAPRGRHEAGDAGHDAAL